MQDRYIIRPEYLSGGDNEISGKMRTILVDWLVQVHLRFHLLQETLYLTVAILDRYLQVGNYVSPLYYWSRRRTDGWKNFHDKPRSLIVFVLRTARLTDRRSESYSSHDEPRSSFAFVRWISGSIDTDGNVNFHDKPRSSFVFVRCVARATNTVGRPHGRSVNFHDNPTWSFVFLRCTPRPTDRRTVGRTETS